jgi:hypothetical protein
MRQVPATKFARNFRRYREIAQREPVAVTRRGRATGYFVSAIDPKRTLTKRPTSGRAVYAYAPSALRSSRSSKSWGSRLVFAKMGVR